MAWWASSISAANDAEDEDDDDDKESLIDLTSDTKGTPSQGAARAASPPSSSNDTRLLSPSPWAIKIKAEKKVKSEDMKRTAEASEQAQQSGDVTVTSGLSEAIDDVICRPAKRSKGGGGGGGAAGGSSSQEADKDLELVKTTGTTKLPHNRFACTEHKFEGLHGNRTHEEMCSLCFCYICDRPASACVDWLDHCHATDTGPMKSIWKSLRDRAKPLLQAGKRPPVSGCYASGSSSCASGEAQEADSSPARAVAAAAAAASFWPNTCNCEELCKPIHQLFVHRHWTKDSGIPPRSNAAVVYLNDLSPQQVKHVEDISIKPSVERAAKIEHRPVRRLQPELRVVKTGANRSNLTVLTGDPESGNYRSTFKPKWTPGAATPIPVRFGGTVAVGFEVSMSSVYGSSSSTRKEYFDRFVSKKPLTPTLWFSTTRTAFPRDRVENGAISILREEDRNLLEHLKRAYETELFDIEAVAIYDPVSNSGSYLLDVALLKNILHRGEVLARRSVGVDFIPLVERFALDRTNTPPLRSSSSPFSSSPSNSKKKLSTWISNGGGGGGAESSAAGPVCLGRKFTSSMEGYGGYSSLDVSLAGLVDSVRDEEENPMVKENRFIDSAEMLVELENLQHRSLPKQPDCLMVELYEHQKQAVQWMVDQEMLEGGTMQHVWAELPIPPSAPELAPRVNEFRRCWYSPILNLFTLNNPFTSTLKGGILCDEMGLGKTAATLCLHLTHPAKTPAPGVPLDETEWGPIVGTQAERVSDLPSSSNLMDTEAPGQWVSKGTLVVCKVSLVGHWVEEAKHLCGGALKIYAYHGEGGSADPSFLAEFDIVVTTYRVVQADARMKVGSPPLRRIRWWRVVLDESHTISFQCSAVMKLVSSRRWCVTGTPHISPSMTGFCDVKSQLDFIGAGVHFKNRELGHKGIKSSTQVETIAFLRRVLLRHSQGMKLEGKSILGLPAIKHRVEVLAMPSRERKAYEEFERGVQKDCLRIRHRLPNVPGSHTVEVHILLSKLRQACVGGQLLIGDSAGGARASSSVDAFCPTCNEILESPVKAYCGHTFCEACITSVLTNYVGDEAPCPKCEKPVRLCDLRSVGGGGGAAAGGGGASSYGATPEPHQQDNGSGGGSSSSGSSPSWSKSAAGVVMEIKLRTLVKNLDDIHREDPTSKSVVFYQFNSSLEWLKRLLPKHGFQFRTMTRAMSRHQTTAALHAFTEDPPRTVFLLSVRVGALGLNLTPANNVFLLEPLLNLTLEKQAIARVYRLGQTRPVTVTKLVLGDSVETRILALLEKQVSERSVFAAVGTPCSSGTNGRNDNVAGNITSNDSKNLKVQEYNALLGIG